MEDSHIVLIVLGVLLIVIVMLVFLFKVFDTTGLKFKKIKKEDYNKYYDKNEILKNQSKYYSKYKK